jgi:hypothetical protein
MKHLIAYTALLLPMGLAQAQYGGSQQKPAPTSGASAGRQTGPVQVTPATDADFTKGKAVKDLSGQLVGTIDSTTEVGVVLAIGKQLIQVPKSAIGKNDSGLVMAMTRTQVEAGAGDRSPN